MAKKILGVYKITYGNGNGIAQQKNLISHEDYLDIIIPQEKLIYELEKENNYRETKESKQIKNELKDLFGGLWFTDKSPLYYASVTGILSLPQTQGGNHKCFLKKIE